MQTTPQTKLSFKEEIAAIERDTRRIRESREAMVRELALLDEDPARVAFLRMRMLVRLHQQTEIAHGAGRLRDRDSLSRLIGNLEYRIYGGGCINFAEVK